MEDDITRRYPKANPPPPELRRAEYTPEEMARLKGAVVRQRERMDAAPKHRWSGSGTAVCLDCGKSWYLAIEHDQCRVRMDRGDTAENDAARSVGK